MFPAARSKAWKQQRAAQRASSQLDISTLGSRKLHCFNQRLTFNLSEPTPELWWTVQVILHSKPGCLLRYLLDRVGSFKWVLWLRTWHKTIPKPSVGWCLIFHDGSASHDHFWFLLGRLLAWGQTHLDSLTFNLLNQTKTLSAALICYLMLGTQQGCWRGHHFREGWPGLMENW